MHFSAFVVLSILCVAYGEIPFVIKNCENVPGSSKLLDIKWGKVKDYPVVIPGKVTISGAADVKEALDPSNKKYDLDLSISRSLLGAFIPVPCVANLGSCTYDLCQYVQEHFQKIGGCPSVLVKNNIPCTCDKVVATSYSVEAATIEVAKEAVKTSLLYGDYKIDLKVLDHDSKEVLTCVHIEATLDKPEDADCGFFCSIFG